MTISIDNIVNYVAIVLDLIHCQEWTELGKVLSQQKLLKVISEHIQKCDEYNGMTLLHAVVRYNPPMHILDAIILAHGDALGGQDCVGRTPLHVACGSGAHYQIITRLVIAFPRACDLQDEDGRLPLHLACDTECALFEGDVTPRAPPHIDVVKVLLSGSLQAVLVEDKDEMNPIEYAIISNLSMRIVRLLQKSSMIVRMKEAEAKTIKGKVASKSSTTKKEDKPIPVLSQ